MSAPTPPPAPPIPVPFGGVPVTLPGTPTSQTLPEILAPESVIDQAKNCSRCPSFLRPTAQNSLFGGTLNSPQCVRFGHVLGNPLLGNGANKQIQVERANACEHFGDAYDPMAEGFGGNTVVFESTKFSETETAYEEVRSCRNCMFFAQPSVVASETGWSTASCLKKKILIPSSEVRTIAADCTVSHSGSSIANGAGWALAEPKLLKQFDANFAAASVMLFFDDPLDFESCKPLTDEDKAHGILGWKELIVDGFKIAYPVFDPTSFTDAQRAKIPRPGDPEHPENYVDYMGAVYKVMATWLGMGETPSLVGPAGVGKSELGRFLAYLMQIPFERISITESTELDDLAGKWLVSKERGTYFQHGRLPLAWEQRCIVLIDEPNTGQPAVWQFLRPLTDNSKQLVLDAASGEKVIQHKYAFLIMAMNPAWDPRNTGIDVVSDADGSRLMHIRMDLPDREMEKKIIQSHVSADGWQISQQQLNMLLGVAAGIRALSERQEISITWGLRTQIKIARALRFHPTKIAYRLATDHLHPDEQGKIMAIVATKAA